MGAQSVTNTHAPSIAPSVVSCSGSVVSVIESDIGVLENRQLMLLDLRDEQAFRQQHIVGATHYPATYISQDKVSPEVYRMKSQPDKLLVVYHEDDRQGAAYATQLVQKGWDNIYLLSGGIADVREHYAELLDELSRPATQASQLSSLSRK